MIALCYHKNFLASANQLPEKHQDKLARLLTILQENPFQPLLHTKRLSGPLAGFFSFRITRNWRVTFQFNDPKTIQLLRIRHRKDAYR